MISIGSSFVFVERLRTRRDRTVDGFTAVGVDFARGSGVIREVGNGGVAVA